MRAAADLLPVIQHENAVCMADRRCALRDDKDRRLLREIAQRPAQSHIRFHIKCRGAVIENEEFGLPYQRAGNGQALALTAGEILAALGERFVESLCLCRDDILRLRRFQRRVQLFLGGVAFAPFQVLADRSLKQHRLLRHNADSFAECLARKGFAVDAVHGNAAGIRLIEAGNQVDQRGFAGARAADDADDFSALCGKRNILNGGFGGICIGEGYIVKGNATALFLRNLRDSVVLLNGVTFLQNGCNAIAAGGCFCQCNDEICKLQQLNQNLRHPVIERQHRTLCQQSGFDTQRADIDQRNDCTVQNDVSDGIHQRGNASDFLLHSGKRVVFGTELRFLCLLAPERTDHADAGQIFACGIGHAVKLCLHLAVERNRREHDRKYCGCQQGNGHSKDQCRLHIDRECHNHRAEHDKRRAQQQPDRQIDAGLHLGKIAGHARNERGGAEGIEILIGQPGDMHHEGAAELCGKAGRCFCGEILCKQRCAQSDCGEQNEQSAHAQQIAFVTGGNARVHDGCNDQRHKQFKDRLQHFEERPQDAFFFIIAEILQ